MRRAYTIVLYVMAVALAAIAARDPVWYARLAELAPSPFQDAVADLMRVDQVLTLSIGVLSLGAAVLRTHGHREALRWTAVASWAFLLVPSLVGLIPFGYWYLGVRKPEARGR